MTLDLKKLSFHYPDSKELFSYSLQALPGTITAVTGPSGSGKSTLFSLIGGFLHPQEGTLTYNEKNLLPLPPGQRPVTTLFQSDNLFPHLTLLQNASLGINGRLRLDKTERQQVFSLLETLGLSGLAERTPNTLSGGQQQRAALARALLRNKPILLLDEPFSALDSALRTELFSLLRQLCTTRNLTVLFISHLETEFIKADQHIRISSHTSLKEKKGD